MFPNQNLTQASRNIFRNDLGLAKYSGLMFSRVTLLSFPESSSEFCHTNLNIKSETFSNWDHSSSVPQQNENIKKLYLTPRSQRSAYDLK